MTKNTGSPSERSFEDMLLSKFGTKVFVYRIDDAKTACGLNGKVVRTNKRPSDYIVTANKEMFYAEVKSCNHIDRGSFKVREGQRVAMVRQLAAGGEYHIFLHNLNTDVWYRISARHIVRQQQSYFSWKWDDLRNFIY